MRVKHKILKICISSEEMRQKGTNNCTIYHSLIQAHSHTITLLNLVVCAHRYLLVCSLKMCYTFMTDDFHLNQKHCNHTKNQWTSLKFKANSTACLLKSSNWLPKWQMPEKQLLVIVLVSGLLTRDKIQSIAFLIMPYNVLLALCCYSIK